MEDGLKLEISYCIDAMLEYEGGYNFRDDFDRLLYRISFAAGYFKNVDRDMNRLLHAICMGERMVEIQNG